MIDKVKKNYEKNNNDGDKGGDGKRKLSDMVNHYDDDDGNNKKTSRKGMKGGRKEELTTASGFKSLGLSENVHRGIIKLGFRVSLIRIMNYFYFFIRR